jgi:hypothetical protein
VLNLELTESTGAMLGSGLVIAVFGAFAIGVAVEGPISYSARRRGTHNDLEVAISGALSVVLVGLVIYLLGGYLRRFATDLPLPFDLAVTVIRSTGSAGMTMALFLGIPALWGVRELWGHAAWVEEIELPILYFVWASGAAYFIASTL